jgi:hypothetical protein
MAATSKRGSSGASRRLYLNVRPPIPLAVALELIVDLRAGEVGEVRIFKRSKSLWSVMGDDM